MGRGENQSGILTFIHPGSHKKYSLLLPHCYIPNQCYTFLTNKYQYSDCDNACGNWIVYRCVSCLYIWVETKGQRLYRPERKAIIGKSKKKKPIQFFLNQRIGLRHLVYLLTETYKMRSFTYWTFYFWHSVCASN